MYLVHVSGGVVGLKHTHTAWSAIEHAAVAASAQPTGVVRVLATAPTGGDSGAAELQSVHVLPKGRPTPAVVTPIQACGVTRLALPAMANPMGFSKGCVHIDDQLAATNNPDAPVTGASAAMAAYGTPGTGYVSL